MNKKLKKSVWLEYYTETPPASIVEGFVDQEDECVAGLLAGIPDEGGSATKRNFEMLVRTAFQSGLIATRPEVHQLRVDAEAWRMLAKGKEEVFQKLLGFARAIEPILADAAWRGVVKRELYQECVDIRPLIYEKFNVGITEWRRVAEGKVSSA